MVIALFVFMAVIIIDRHLHRAKKFEQVDELEVKPTQHQINIAKQKVGLLKLGKENDSEEEYRGSMEGISMFDPDLPDE